VESERLGRGREGAPNPPLGTSREKKVWKDATARFPGTGVSGTGGKKVANDKKKMWNGNGTAKRVRQSPSTHRKKGNERLTATEAPSRSLFLQPGGRWAAKKKKKGRWTLDSREITKTMSSGLEQWSGLTPTGGPLGREKKKGPA